MIKKPLVILSLILFSFQSQIGFAAESLIGKKAPLIKGKNIRGGGILSLASLMKGITRKKDSKGNFIEQDGKYVFEVNHNLVVLNFFSTSCIPCIKEIPAYNQIARKFRDQPVKLIYVNVDANKTQSDIKRFIIRKKIKVPMMMPNQKDAIKKYNVVSLPRLVIVDFNHNIQKILIGAQSNFEERLTGMIDTLITNQKQKE
jgi:thiol-disulfide isomerase/thioredoxin